MARKHGMLTANTLSATIAPLGVIPEDDHVRKWVNEAGLMTDNISDLGTLAFHVVSQLFEAREFALMAIDLKMKRKIILRENEIGSLRAKTDAPSQAPTPPLADMNKAVKDAEALKARLVEIRGKLVPVSYRK